MIYTHILIYNQPTTTNPLPPPPTFVEDITLNNVGRPNSYVGFPQYLHSIITGERSTLIYIHGR